VRAYDFDASTCLNFLREYGLLEHFKLNLETNHATLAGHTMHHECEVAAAAGALAGAEFRDRVTASRKVLRSAQARNELSGGYAFQFEASTERLHQLAELIDAERQCCPFLTFVLQVPAQKNALILEIKGPEGAKRLIRAELLVD
jgi:hypothetical protein